MIEATALTEDVSSLNEDLFAQAMVLHQGWDFQGAERLYRQVLEEEPEHADANHNLGILLAIQGLQPSAALPYFEAALNSDSTNMQYWFSYVDALIRAERIELAGHVLKLAQAHGLQPAMASILSEQMRGRRGLLCWAGWPLPLPAPGGCAVGAVAVACCITATHSPSAVAVSSIHSDVGIQWPG